MRVEVMQYFVEIADMKSISRLSKKNNIPQQSLSSMIFSLENELGVQLFFRSGIGLTLTKAGKEFYEFCENFLNEYNKLQKQLKPENVKQKMTVKVITQNNIAQTLIPKWIGKLLKYAPEIELEITVGNASQVLEYILSGQAEIGFLLIFKKNGIIFPELPKTCAFFPLFFSSPYFWVNINNPLYYKKSLSINMLRDQMIIEDMNADNELFRYILKEHLKHNGMYYPTANSHIILEILKNNVAICPDLKPEHEKLGLEFLLGSRNDMHALPLTKKDNYKIFTGYVMKKTNVDEGQLKNILKYIST